MTVFSAQDSIAVIGVSQDPNKFGHKVFKDLLESGHTVFAVNPKGGEVFGKPVYESVSQLPAKIDLLVLVVPPEISEQVAKEAADLGITRIWFQPGSENEKVMKYCQQQGLDYIVGKCVMVERLLSSF